LHGLQYQRLDRTVSSELGRKSIEHFNVPGSTVFASCFPRELVASVSIAKLPIPSSSLMCVCDQFHGS
jgi:hypothetical protein